MQNLRQKFYLIQKAQDIIFKKQDAKIATYPKIKNQNTQNRKFIFAKYYKKN